MANIEEEYKAKNWEGLRTPALQRARQNNVTSIERLLLSVCLFDDDVEKAAFFLCHYMLTVPSGQAITYRNVASLQRLAPAARRHVAEVVWYPVKGHDMHTLLMRGAQTKHLVGGAADFVGALALQGETLVGGEYRAPVIDAVGNVVAHVDLSDLEAFLSGVQATGAQRYRTVEAKLASLVTAAKSKQRRQRLSHWDTQNYR
ncbi:hypothetical protein ABB37_06072 [Leptomonas pyrrhocoris]|uniref:Uncharacterized protein n=1 Tax=Leptomonas pyrrhocoris TaxID=157538 RepID=A0A0M9FY30_LEPPY|nr:hypothetical protein ABB37_06072 [Leptomonas pyrrhocoris]KPA78445.1 hypothetical protein ABB37_06072 [Leptomonas pyrrhocoris]|eukprot:XP_015656884.1 hypothetical protein ABB37_06072 [Leptomonas pyrrhocoris]